MDSLNLSPMKRKLLVGMLIILSLMGAGQGRLPQVNDTVGIMVGGGYAWEFYSGNITDITESFIGLNVSESQVEFANGQSSQHSNHSPPVPVCIGIGSITKIVWE